MDISYKDSSTYKLFNGLLNDLLTINHFKRINGSDKDSSAHKYKACYTRSFLDMHGHSMIYTIEVVGISMGTTLLLCYGNITDNDDFSVRIKIMLDESEYKIKKRFKEEFINKLIDIISPGINDLPPEILIKISKHLDLKSLINLSYVNSSWNQICNEQSAWKHLCKRDFRLKDGNTNHGINWKAKYKHEHLRKKQEDERKCWVMRSLPPPPEYLPIGPPLGPPLYPDRPQILPHLPAAVVPPEIREVRISFEKLH